MTSKGVVAARHPEPKQSVRVSLRAFLATLGTPGEAVSSFRLSSFFVLPVSFQTRSELKSVLP